MPACLTLVLPRFWDCFKFRYVYRLYPPENSFKLPTIHFLALQTSVACPSLYRLQFKGDKSRSIIPFCQSCAEIFPWGRSRKRTTISALSIHMLATQVPCSLTSQISLSIHLFRSSTECLLYHGAPCNVVFLGEESCEYTGQARQSRTDQEVKGVRNKM